MLEIHSFSSHFVQGDFTVIYEEPLFVYLIREQEIEIIVGRR